MGEFDSEVSFDGSFGADRDVTGLPDPGESWYVSGDGAGRELSRPPVKPSNSSVVEVEADGHYEGSVWVPSGNARYGITPEGLRVYREPEAREEGGLLSGETGAVNLRSTANMIGAAVGIVATIALVKHGIDSGWVADQARTIGEEFERWANSPAGQ